MADVDGAAHRGWWPTRSAEKEATGALNPSYPRYAAMVDSAGSRTGTGAGHLLSHRPSRERIAAFTT